MIDALLLPKEVSVCKCQDHTTGGDGVSRGNRVSDLAAKAAALLPTQITSAARLTEEVGDIEIMQPHASSSGKEKWKKAGCVFVNGRWRGPINNWFTKGFSTVAADYCNVGRGQAMRQAGHPISQRPFSHVMLDYIELTQSDKKEILHSCGGHVFKMGRSYANNKGRCKEGGKTTPTGNCPTMGYS